MSVPVRYDSNVNFVVQNDNICPLWGITSAEELLSRQGISMMEGRLGTPDAAGGACSGPFVETKNMMTNNNYEEKSAQMTTEALFIKLHEALSLESKYQPGLYLPQESQNGEITVGARDGAAHVLRCLKVWYDLPTDVLFTAINLVDRFLTKMKVRPKHMACMSVGSFNLAVNQLGLPKMDTEDLVAISQCRCTAGDLERMSGIIANKLGIQMNTEAITALSFVRIFYSIFKNAAIELGLSEFYNSAISLQELEKRMEILICDANCASIRGSELALVLICTQMDAHLNNMQQGGTVTNQVHGLVDYAIELQKLCRIPDSTFFHSHSTVAQILSHYNGQNKMPYRQRLVWKLSSRTMRLLRPTDRLTSYLPTIEEHNINNSLSAANLARLRTGSCSSEEGEDWPTSPVVPVCEKC